MQSVSEGTRLLPSLDEGINILHLITKAQESSESGKLKTLD